MTDYDYTFKVLMLGDASVGKTSLTLRYISGYFTEDLKLTIGVDFYSKILTVSGKKVKLQIWDFGGEERFRFLLPHYSLGANGAFFLYDITNALTLESISSWTDCVKSNAGNIPIMLVGSKLDLERFRAILREDGIQAARKHKLASFVELSSKTGQNVKEAFETLTEILLKRATS